MKASEIREGAIYENKDGRPVRVWQEIRVGTFGTLGWSVIELWPEIADHPGHAQIYRTPAWFKKLLEDARGA